MDLEGHHRVVRAPALAFVALAVLILPSISGATSAANFGAHAGLSEDTVPDPYFVAGSLLADLNHFLPPTETVTDTETFAWGVVWRSWGASRHAWALARGWLEHMDQDDRFANSVATIQVAYPSYTWTDVRLAFDYWTLTKHPFSTEFDFLLADGEVHAIVAGGLAETDAAGVRSAIYQLLYSTDINAPGLFAQLNASRLYAVLYPQVVQNLEPYYDAFYSACVARFVDPFPPLARMLMYLGILVRRLPAGVRYAIEPFVSEARGLERSRVPGWLESVRGDLREVVQRSAGSPEIVGEAALQILDATYPP